MTLYNEGLLLTLPNLFCLQPEEFMLLYSPAYFRGGVAVIKVPLGHKHVTFGELRVGLVTLFHDHKCVPHVVV